MMHKIGTQVRHKLSISMYGRVIGYGTIANPWSGETHGVYLVDMYDPIRIKKDGPTGSISVQVWSPEHTEAD